MTYNAQYLPCVRPWHTSLSTPWIAPLRASLCCIPRASLLISKPRRMGAMLNTILIFPLLGCYHVHLLYMLMSGAECHILISLWREVCSREHTFCKVTCNVHIYEQKLLSQFTRETLGASEQAIKTVIKPKETNNRASTSSQGSGMAGSAPEEGAGFLALGLFQS